MTASRVLGRGFLLMLLFALPTIASPIRYSIADLGSPPEFNIQTSAILSYARRPILDEQGNVAFGSGTQYPDDVMLNAIQSPRVLRYGGLFAESPGTGYRVGYVAGPDSLRSPWQAVRWDQSAQVGETLGGFLGPDEYSVAMDVNRSGHVVGEQGITNNPYSNDAAAWGGSGSSWDPFLLLQSALELNSVAFGINDNDDIVGIFKASSPLKIVSYSDTPHAFLLRNGELFDLNDLIDPDSGWILESAGDINNAGQISGYGRDSSGPLRAFVLTPSTVPEPGTLTLAGTTLALAALRRWRKQSRP